MQLIILDFIRRRWWIFPLVAGFAILGMATAQSMVFTHLVIIVLIFDAQRGLLRTVRPLPVSRRSQAAAWWFIGVLLAPLVTFFALPIGALISHAVSKPRMLPIPTVDAALPYAFVLAPDYFAPWFSAGISAWVSLGYAAFCFLLCIGLPTRPASSGLETFWQGVFGGLWGLSFSGPMLFMFVLPKNPGAILPWHWVLFALVPVLLVLSFIGAPDMMARRMFALSAAGKPGASGAPHIERGGLTGIPLLITSAMGRVLTLLALIFVMQMLFNRWIGLGAVGADRASFGQLAAFAVIFGALAGATAGLRVLRVLPLSTAQLALLLLSIPAALGFICGSFITIVGGFSDPPWSVFVALLARIFVIAGAGGLALTAWLHTTSGGRFVGFALVAMLPSSAVLFIPQFSIWLLLGGGASLVAAYLLLVRGLRNSSAFYQARSFFGINIGQQLVGR